MLKSGSPQISPGVDDPRSVRRASFWMMNCGTQCAHADVLVFLNFSLACDYKKDCKPDWLILLRTFSAEFLAASSGDNALPASSSGNNTDGLGDNIGENISAEICLNLWTLETGEAPQRVTPLLLFSCLIFSSAWGDSTFLLFSWEGKIGNVTQQRGWSNTRCKVRLVKYCYAIWQWICGVLHSLRKIGCKIPYILI